MPIQVVTYTSGTTIVSLVYFVLNLLFYSLFTKRVNFLKARNLLSELFAQQVEIFISILMVDEVWWGLLGEWYYADTTTRITTKKIKNNPSILSTYHHRFQGITSNMLSWANTTFLPTDTIRARSTIQCALSFLTQESVRPRDSFHLALATLSNAAGFITSDSDFDNITLSGKNLTIYKY